MRRLLPVLLSLTACAAPLAPVGGTPAEAPLLGAADGSDSADRTCQVVLRAVRRATESDGRAASACVDGRCWLALDAWVDVADDALADGGAVEVLYRDASGAAWYASAAATPIDGAAPGFSRFSVRLAEGGIRDGLSGTAMARARLELAPYLRAPSGSRVFDHNERPGDFDNLVVDGAAGFAFDADPAVCPGPTVVAPDAVLTFDAAFGESLDGTVRAGGTLAVDYDPARLPQCLGDTYMGRRTWDTLAWLRAWPSGETLPYQSVVACDDGACGAPSSARVTFSLPDDTEAVELWFSTSGRSCGVHYDSDFGRNYRWSVARPVGWVGGFVAKISRAGGAPCEGSEAASLGEGLSYGTWARTRAAISHVCFSVWSEGVTDRASATLDDAISAALVCRFEGASEPRRYAVDFDASVGNDARYRASLRAMDPFAPYRCPEVPTRVEGSYEVTDADCWAEVNGASWGPAGEGAAFHVQFADYPDNAWRAANCL